MLTRPQEIRLGFLRYLIAGGKLRPAAPLSLEGVHVAARAERYLRAQAAAADVPLLWARREPMPPGD